MWIQKVFVNDECTETNSVAAEEHSSVKRERKTAVKQKTRYVVQLFTQLQTAAGARDVLYSNASLKAKIQPNLYMYLSTRYYSYRYSV